MHYRMGFESNFIAATDFGGAEPTVEIESVTLEQLEDDRGQVRNRLVARFVGKKRGWVINKTNAIVLSKLFKSDDTDGWIGHKVTLTSAKVYMAGAETTGIRIKGSPELTAPLDVELKLPKKKAIMVRLVPTGKAPANAD